MADKDGRGGGMIYLLFIICYLLVAMMVSIFAKYLDDRTFAKYLDDTTFTKYLDDTLIIGFDKFMIFCLSLMWPITIITTIIYLIIVALPYKIYGWLRRRR